MATMVRSSRSRTPASLLSMKTVLKIICCLLCVNALQYNQHAKGKLVRDGGKQECRAMPAQGPCTKNQEQAAGRGGGGGPARRAPPPVGPPGPPPVYVDAGLDLWIIMKFRGGLARAMGRPDVPTPGYAGLMELVAILDNENSDKKYVQEVARQTLQSFFPSWLPPAFSVLFSKNAPALACRINAWVASRTCGWLVGPEMEVNDAGQGLLVKRCRCLEESGCASICVNTCKIPTQTFFKENMGLPLLMEPNYEDFSCQFSFGKSPPLPQEDESFQVACLTQCPNKASGLKSKRQCSKLELEL